jgi:hypothetical protein
MKRRFRFGGACLALLVVGCGGGGSSAPPTMSDFCKQLAQAECSKVNCAGSAPEPCETNRTASCLAWATAVTAGNVRQFTPANMNDCINRSRTAYSSTNPITPQTLADIDRACNYVFQGKKMLLTDACTTQFECAGTTNGTIVCDKGFCATVSAGKAAGTPCGNPGDTCAAGNYCAKNASDLFVCMARVASGGVCSDAKPCVENLRCAAGICSERVMAGASCGSDVDCPMAAPFCDPYASSICDSGLSFAAGSPSCQSFTGGNRTNGGGGAGGSAGGAGGSAGGGAGGAAGGAAGRGGAGGATGGAGGAAIGGAGGLGGGTAVGGAGALGGAGGAAAGAGGNPGGAGGA